MQGINVNRWLVGGLVAAAVIWVLEGVMSMLYMDRMETALSAHGLSMTLTAGTMVLSIAVSLLVGLVLVFFYAAARPRFGPGPATAVKVAVALWAGSYLVAILGYQMLGLFPPGLLALWAVLGLVEVVLAALVGGRLYQEA